jgi:hypothetical protein
MQVVEDHALVQESDLLPRCAPLSSSTNDHAAADDDEGRRRQCYYEAFVRTHVLGPLGMTSSLFLPPPAEWGDCMPTAVPNAEGLLSTVLQGRVNDGNA